MSCDEKTVLTYAHFRLTGAFVDKQPGLIDKWISQNPQNRIARPDELRGVITWLASDASTYCTGSEYVSYILTFLARADETSLASSSTVVTARGRCISTS